MRPNGTRSEGTCSDLFRNNFSVSASCSSAPPVSVAPETRPDTHTYRMQTFCQWLSQLRETYFTFDTKQYNRLFDDALETLLQRVRVPAHRQILEGLRDFDWIANIAASVRHAGFHDQREVQERTHDIAVKPLVGKLFTGFDEGQSGRLRACAPPMPPG